MNIRPAFIVAEGLPDNRVVAQRDFFREPDLRSVLLVEGAGKVVFGFRPVGGRKGRVDGAQGWKVLGHGGGFLREGGQGGISLFVGCGTWGVGGLKYQRKIRKAV